MQYASRKDERHAPIKAELEAAGFFIVDLSNVGKGCPDLAISRNGVWAFVELKTPIGAKTALQRLTTAQIAWHSQAKGPIITAYTASQVLSDFNLLLKRRQASAVTEQSEAYHT
jgi:hypothetical protein